MAYDATLNERKQVQYDVLTYKLDVATNEKLVHRNSPVANKGLNPDYFSGNKSKLVNILNSFYETIDLTKQTVAEVYTKFNPVVLDVSAPENKAILDQMRAATGKDTLIESVLALAKGEIGGLAFLNPTDANDGHVVTFDKTLNKFVLKPAAGGSGSGLTQDQKDKLDKIVIDDPNGKLFLANDGTYKNITPFVDLVTTTTDGLMRATDKVNLDKVAGIVKNDAGADLFLAGDGTYKTVTATVTTIAAVNATYDNTKVNKLTSTNVQEAIDEILTGMPLIDDTAATTDFTKLLSAGKIYDLLNGKANETHTHVCADITDLTSKYYDIPTIDQKIADVTTGVIWKESVATYTDIATTYPTPETGWLVATLDTQQIYRYNGTTWEKFGSMAIQSEATHTEKGLMSAADKVKLDAIDETAPRIYYQSTTPPLINGTIWVEE